MKGYGLKLGDANGSALKAIIFGLVILSAIAGLGQAFHTGRADTALPVVGRTSSGSIVALAELPTDFGPPSPGPTDPSGPFPGP